MDNIIGIDLGGTTIKGGRIEGDEIVKIAEYPTHASEGGEKTLGILKDTIRSLMNEQTLAIGIGVPSVVDRTEGIVYNVQNIAGWEEVHLRSILEEEFGLPVRIDNDSNCFAYGEKIYGKGRNYSDFVGVTLGTGLGAGIVKDGRLIPDVNCGSGEFGEIPYLESRLEDYCSSHFFSSKVEGTGKELALKARKGDRQALGAFDEFGSHLSALVKIIILVLDPQAIIFGGAISRSFDLFEPAMTSGLSDFPYPKSVENLKIQVSELEHSGILGAASLCMELN